ncbi:MAG: ABC transporter ATP-binding protein [Desulfobacteraceae bacterium 4484_190.3]|nr:MAG: ABC transporter ATP-binding protein [Desulfobacteraceae bacterium 4484_190.3]
MLKIKNIEVRYHEVILVLKGVSIEVPKGGIIALLGANGAGKSTTLKAISGLLKVEDGEVTDGSIEFEGRRIHHEKAARIAKMGIVQVIEGRRVFEHLTVEENLMTEPKLVLLDEPSMGLAPMLIHEIFNIIMKLNKEQRISILLVEQNAKLALNVAPYAYVMETGRIVMDDTAEKLSENEDIKDFYLGLSDKSGKRKSFRDVKHYKRRKRWLS